VITYSGVAIQGAYAPPVRKIRQFFLCDFSIILNSFPPWSGLCPGPAVRSYKVPPDPLVGWAGDAPSILIGLLDLGAFLTLCPAQYKFLGTTLRTLCQKILTMPLII